MTFYQDTKTAFESFKLGGRYTLICLFNSIWSMDISFLVCLHMHIYYELNYAVEFFILNLQF